MKRKIGLGVVAGMVIALGSFAPAAAGVDPQPFQPALNKLVTNVTLLNGVRAEINGGRLFLVGADGKKTLATDGIYKTSDGKTLTVKGGVLSSPGIWVQ